MDKNQSPPNALMLKVTGSARHLKRESIAQEGDTQAVLPLLTEMASADRHVSITQRTRINNSPPARLPDMPLFKSSASPSRSSLTLAPPSVGSSRSPSPTATPRSTGSTAMQDDTFRNVKLVEELLRAWNDHRQALSACGKTGKKLAKAMEELSQGVDKTSVTG